MKIKELLTVPDKWTTGAFARDIDGNVISPLSKEARSWCLAGAASKCYLNLGDDIKVTQKIYDAVGETPPAYNDTHTYEDVIQLVRSLDI